MRRLSRLGVVSGISFVSALVFACGEDGDGGSSSGGAGPSGGSSNTGGSSGSGSPGGTGNAGGSSNTGGAGGTAGSAAAGGSGATGGTGGSSSGGTGAMGGSSAGGVGGSGGVIPHPVSAFIVVDQFGYLPDSEKIAVIRNPETGHDAAESFTPGASYAVVDRQTGQQVHSGGVTAWNGGAVDPSSGDRAHWFDFSSVTTPGAYYVLDVDQAVRSYEFVISADVYRDVLEQAVRTFFYQRAGQKKEAQHAGAEWADEASHLGVQQDTAARLYTEPNHAATEKDLQGGWYDAGDYSKYTNWTAAYVISLLRAYAENPQAFTDDYEIPESGNGVPDILDEAKWGIDHLARMQNADGSVLSIVGLSHASPPSATTGPSRYGPASTSATLSTAAALALGAKVLGSQASHASYASSLVPKAESAWSWADANPSVTFRNNDAGYGSQGLGAGQQETDDYGRQMLKLEASCYLFDATAEAQYKSYFDANYASAHLIQWTYVYPFETNNQDILLHYTRVAGATASVVTAIKNAFRTGMQSADNLKALDSAPDPYLGHIADYTWGSNSTKSSAGDMFYDIITYGIDSAANADARRGAERYLHYLHGTNPFSLVYLSNMNGHGAENSVNEFYHSWFTDGSAKWDRVGVSQHGPAPGFLVGGPNPTYDWDACCPNNCITSQFNAVCTAESINPPKGQPDQKSYKEFNTNWPLNSWSVTENSNGYQANYIRLLSKFVK